MARRLKSPDGPACGPNLPVVSLRLGTDRCTGVKREAVRTPADAYRAVKAAFSGCEAQERFVALLLDHKHRPIAVQDVAKGSESSVAVDMKDVMGGALVARASAIILAHNHPSCEVEPSPQDLALTKRLSEVGRLVGVQVLDHLVVCTPADRWTSIEQRAPSAFGQIGRRGRRGRKRRRRYEIAAGEKIRTRGK